MAVYVDDMYAPFGRMKMCHLIANTTEELQAMVKTIDVAWRWRQHANRYDEHFDIAMSKRKLAVEHGAIEVTWRQLGCMIMRRRETGNLGSPDDAVIWAQEHMDNRSKRELKE